MQSHDGTRGFDDQHGAQSQGYYGGGGHEQYGGGHDRYGGGHYADGHGEKKDKDGKEKKKDNSGMMLGAAAGVGAGVVGGVLLADALGTSTSWSKVVES